MVRSPCFRNDGGTIRSSRNPANRISMPVTPPDTAEENGSGIFSRTIGFPPISPPVSRDEPSCPAIKIELPPVADSKAAGSTQRIIVGRFNSADLVLADPLLSRSHFEFIVHHGNWHVRDLNSKNGTTFNDVTLSQTPRQVSDGDKLKAGSSKFVVCLP